MQRLLHGIKITLAVSRRIIGEVKVFNRPDGIYFTCLYCDKQHLLKSKEIIRDQKDFGISMKLLSWDCSWVTIPLQDFFYNDTSTTEIYTLSLHDALDLSAS